MLGPLLGDNLLELLRKALCLCIPGVVSVDLLVKLLDVLQVHIVVLLVVHKPIGEAHKDG